MGFCPEGDTLVSPCVKYTLILVNFILWLCSICVIGVGVWAYIETNKFFYQPVESIYDILLNLPIIIIVIGGCNFITTFCGFVGALRENLILLRIFYVSITIVFLMEVAGAVVAFVFRDNASEYITDFLKELFIIRYQDDENAIIDFFQENFACCGINTLKDWNDNEYFNCTDSNPSALKCAVPYSCCKDPDALTPGLPNILCGGGALSPNNTVMDTIYQEGCLEKVIQYAEDNLPIIGAVAVAIAVPQLTGMCLGRLLDTQIQHQRKRYLRAQRRHHRRGS